ncbi:major capsid protein [Dipodfec virus UOA04_Rod_504]|nr:major capsid protein [Dipodfec virus UOA04_Rod_504]
MAKNPFKANQNVVNKPKRNAFDLSFTNNLTFNFGELIPVMCVETLPGDSFNFDSAMALRFMPLSFPIQTKCRAHVHFFYQRAKNLWDGFDDWINGNDKLMSKPLVPPYLNLAQGYGNGDNLRTGSLGDYLGLPTSLFNYKLDNRNFSYIAPVGPAGEKEGYVLNPPLKTDKLPSVSPVLGEPFDYSATTLNNDLITHPSQYSVPVYSSVSTSNSAGNVLQALGWVVNNPPKYSNFRVSITIESKNLLRFSRDSCVIVIYDRNSGKYLSQSVPKFTDFRDADQDSSLLIEFDVDSIGASNDIVILMFGVYRANRLSVLPPVCRVYTFNSAIPDSVDKGENPLTDERYYKISALPFRCYESIYNAFYRDSRNNPMYIGSDVCYNKFLPTNAGGKDNHIYDIYHRNWELDQFTSSVSSPQQGVAPLVGISSLGDVTFSHDGQEYTFSTETASDADTITKVNVTENVPNAVARAIVNTVTSGISINDFRNVNAYQRWLETNIRRGLKAKDQALARWGVAPSDAILDMPEFIGGFSVDVDVNQVTNMAQTEAAPLGDIAGQMTAFGGSKHKISHFCDQHGYIMAIVSVVPTPVYSGLLHKMFLRENALDYFSPEFANLGLQPVLYKELCPLLCKHGSTTAANPDENKVFGYQRPWYDYIYKNDECHGLFRTSMNQFIFARNFTEAPSLNAEFLSVYQSQLNDIFAVKSSHNILGQIRFNITAKRPIPSVSIPKL